jgi:hypothetical protein
VYAVFSPAPSRPIHVVSLDPQFVQKRDKILIAGGSAGQLASHRKGYLFFNTQTAIIHEGEGPIHSLVWRGDFIAWATKMGVKIYDFLNNKRVSFVPAPRECPSLSVCRCVMQWETDEILLIGWADQIIVVRLREQPATTTKSPAKAGTAADSSPPIVRVAEILRTFLLDYFVCGLIPFDDANFAVLGYLHTVEDDDDDGEAGGGGGDELDQVPQRPEMRLKDRQTGVEVAIDSLPMKGFESCTALDYSLVAWGGCCGLRAQEAAKQKREGSSDNLMSRYNLTTVDRNFTAGVMSDDMTPVCYVLSPKDIIVARTRDADDHITWALSMDPPQYEEALEIARQTPPNRLRQHKMSTLMESFLNHLFKNNEFEKAASLCPSLLGQDKQLWERWVLEFYEKHQIHALVEFIPTGNPRLSQTTYDFVLRHFVERDPTALLHTIRRWPQVKTRRRGSKANAAVGGDDSQEPLYDVNAWIDRLRLEIKQVRTPAMNQGPKKESVLLEVLAELYRLDHQHSEALNIYLTQLDHTHKAQAQQATASKSTDDSSGNNSYHANASATTISSSEGGGADAASGRGGTSSASAGSQRVLELIRDHNLITATCVQKKVLQLMSYENSELTELLVEKSDDLPLETVYPQLREAPRFQYVYLHTFFKLKQDHFNNVSTTVPRYERYHDLLVELIVEYGTEEELIYFLKHSNFRKPEAALERCEKRMVRDPVTKELVRKPLYNAMVYILGELGQIKEALEKIFETGNVEKAIEFVMTQVCLWPSHVQKRFISDSDTKHGGHDLPSIDSHA